MPVELKIPQAGESITEVEIGEWIKAEGDWVAQDDPVVVIETEKATVELPAPVSGTVSRIVKKKGERASVGDLIGYMEESERPVEQKAGKEAEGSARPQAEEKAAPQAEKKKISEEARAPAPKSAEAERKAERRSEKVRVMPAARRALAEHGLKAEEVQAGGPGGRLLKEDVLRHIEGQEVEREGREEPKASREVSPVGGRLEEAVPMSLVRRRIAERLVEARKNAALLTTFNEIDMAAVIALRKKHQEVFQQKHGIKLGFMSFFVKAAIEALKLIPQVNAEIRGDNIIYRNYYDIGIAVGGGKGLVVPVLRSAGRMSFSEIERAIGDFSRRAQENKLKVEELQGGTFTISNGGVYGSLLSTPIVNPPQSGVLGLHAIQERPVVREGEVVIRPMMYVALTYDHRIIDGREAVTFLKHIKELIEEPARILLEI